MRYGKGILIFLFSLLLMHCGDSSEQVKVAESERSISQGDTLSETGVTITPVEAKANSVITLHADRELLQGGEIQWFINDVRDELQRGIRFISEDLRKGDVLRAIVVREEEEFESNEIIIHNTPPAIVRARLFPEQPKSDSRLSTRIEARDIDEDDIYFKYTWTLNGTFMGETDALDTELKRNDTVSVEVIPYDNEEEGQKVKLTRKIYNSVPVFEQSTPTFNGDTYEYQVIARDPDNDALTFSLEEAPKGMKIDNATGKITWEVEPTDRGHHVIKVRISDNNGGELVVPLSTRITFEAAGL